MVGAAQKAGYQTIGELRNRPFGEMVEGPFWKYKGDPSILRLGHKQVAFLKGVFAPVQPQIR